MKILIINGPNINLLGLREPDIYGHTTFKTLEDNLLTWGRNAGFEVELFQSNWEGAIVDRIQQAYFDDVDGLVINPAAYTHTSVAILDALKATDIPTVEVHISDVTQREAFRQQSYVSAVAVKRIVGHGIDGYREGIEFLKSFLNARQ